MMRRTMMVLAVVAGLGTAGCAGSPQRVAGQAGPVGGATPAVSVPSSPGASPSPSPSRSPSLSPSPSRSSVRPVPPSSAAAPSLPNRITLAGYGALKLGMTLPRAQATGLVADRSDDDRCSTLKLVTTKKTTGLVVYSEEMGVVIIPASDGVSTPEGIRVGSSLARVREAYGELEGDTSGEENAPRAMTVYTEPVGGNRFQIYITDEKVDALFVTISKRDC